MSSTMAGFMWNALCSKTAADPRVCGVGGYRCVVCVVYGICVVLDMCVWCVVCGVCDAYI